MILWAPADTVSALAQEDDVSRHYKDPSAYAQPIDRLKLVPARPDAATALSQAERNLPGDDFVGVPGRPVCNHADHDAGGLVEDVVRFEVGERIVVNIGTVKSKPKKPLKGISTDPVGGVGPAARSAKINTPEIAIDQTPTPLPAIIIGEIAPALMLAKKIGGVARSRRCLKFQDNKEDPQKNQ